ncbi:MAG: universal stress protein [Desulfobacterales bacterium]|jgi:nucleotide-binding universal stress UspA family protein
MTDTILIGIDGSKASEHAVSFAVSQAKSGNSRLVVCYVVEWSPYTFNTPEENEQRHMRRKEEIKNAKERVLNPILKSIESEGVKALGVVRHGQVADVLLQLSKEQDAGQIVVGRIGHSGIKSLLFGSVATKLIQLAHIPVTIVP